VHVGNWNVCPLAHVAKCLVWRKLGQANTETASYRLLQRQKRKNENQNCCDKHMVQSVCGQRLTAMTAAGNLRDRTQKSALVHDSGGNAERSQQACTVYLYLYYCQCKFSWTTCNRPCSRWLYLEIPIWDSNPPRVRPLYCNQEQHRRLQAWVAAAKRGHMLSAASP